MDLLLVHGGAGNDYIEYSRSPTIPARTYGEGGDDHLVEGDGADWMGGGPGSDHFVGDSFFGDTGGDRLYGGPGDDLYESRFGQGVDFFAGGNGFDTVVAGSLGHQPNWLTADGSRLQFGAGQALTLEAIDTELFTSGNHRRLEVGNLSRTSLRQLDIGVRGNGLKSVVIRGTAGPDDLEVLLSELSVIAGLPYTVTVRSDYGLNLIVDGAGGADSLVGSDEDMDEGTLTLRGGTGPDELTGSGVGDLLEGGPGADLLSGRGGRDRFVWRAGDGDDTVLGGAEIDLLEIRGGPAADLMQLIESDSGPALLVSGPAPALIELAVERLVASLAGGADSFGVEAGFAWLFPLRLYGGLGDDSLNGGGGDDFLRGDDGEDSLGGADGADRIVADDGAADDVDGGPGDDFARVDEGIDDVSAVEDVD
jgi:Ca2+-binding RTX toxin-like protein